MQRQIQLTFLCLIACLTSLQAQFTAKNDVKMVVEGFTENIVYKSSEMLVNFDERENKVEFRVRWRHFRPADSSDFIPLDSMFTFPENTFLAIKAFYAPLEIVLDNRASTNKTLEGIISLGNHRTVKRFPISLLNLGNQIVMNCIIHFELRSLNLDMPEKYKSRLTGHIHLVLNRVKWIDHSGD